MKMHLAGAALALTLLGGALGSGPAIAAPASLGGMGVVGQWTDFESGSGEMPAQPWGNSQAANADRVGIYVEYANGLTGSATYSGLTNLWGGCCNIGGGIGITPDTATGFFVGAGTYYARLHGIDNQGFILPMAWTDLQNQFTSNFDLSYENWATRPGGRAHPAGRASRSPSTARRPRSRRCRSLVRSG